MKASELTGAALDWAVARCEGYAKLRQNPHPFDHALIVTPPRGEHAVYLCDINFSTSWEHGGPIIEREGISVRLWIDQGWCAYNEPEGLDGNSDGYVGCSGPTPLIAAMRCYVASKMGEEIEVFGGLD